ncbi:YadA-like family protein [Veillonella caviae]|uniref:YadA-like family protein n=1 Tax=Veillonella caviae TaxID=248316 RepID=UPI002357143F|nr:YadA-like family protein [Veillonella caviae]
MIIEVTKWIKHALKGKVTFSKGMVIAYMMTGVISVGGVGLASAETGGPVNASDNNNVLIGSSKGTVNTDASAIGSNNVVIGTGVSSNSSYDNIVIGSKSSIDPVVYMMDNGQKYAVKTKETLSVYIDNAGYAYVLAADGVTKIYVDNKGIPTANNTPTWLVESSYTNTTVSSSVVIGKGSTANNKQATVLGNNSVAKEEQSLALGSNVEALKFNTTAIGNNAKADGYAAIVIGGDDIGTKQPVYNAVKEANTSYAQMVYDPSLKEVVQNPYIIGNNSTELLIDDGSGNITKGAKKKYKRLRRWNANLGAYEDIPEGDPSMPSTYKWTEIKSNDDAVGKDSTYAWDAMGIVDYYKSQGLTGAELNAAVKAFYSPYQEALSTGAASIAVGIKTQAIADGAIAIGMGNVASGNESISLGVATTTYGERAVAVGGLASASGKRSIAIGTYGHDLADGETRYNSAHATADDAVAIGTASYADYAKGVALGADSITSPYTGLNRATYDPNNTTAPFTYGATTTGGATGTISSATVGYLTYGNFAGATGQGLVSIGSAGHEKRLQNMAAGEISATSTDAINGSQLYSATKAIDTAIPLEYRQISSNGNTLPVVQGLDGKFYSVGDINVDGVTYDPATNTYQNTQGDIINPLTAEQLTIAVKGGVSLSLSNVRDNLPTTYNASATNDPTTYQAPPNAVEVSKIGGNAATVNDILNAGWNLENNGTAKDFVKAYDTVNFVDGAGTKANVTTREDGLISDVTFNIDNGTISAESNGTTTNTGKVIGASKEQKEEAAQKLEDLKTRMPAAEQALNNSKSDLNAALETYNTKETELKAAEQALSTAQQEVTQATTNAAALKTELNTINQKIDAYDAIINSNTASASEVAMAKALKAQAETDKANKEQEITTAEAVLQTAKDAIVDKQNAVTDAETARDQAKDAVGIAQGQVDTDRAALDALKKEKTTAESINNKVATVENVVDAINNSGWNVTTSASDGTVSGTTTELINPGETVTFDAGTNITIKQNGNTITIATGDNPFEYTVTETTPNGTTTTTVTKAPNGKVYKTEDVKNAVYNPVTQAYEEPVIGGDGSPVLNPDGTPAMKTIDPVSDDVANTLTVHTKGDTPQTISNVKSNLPEANKGNAGGTNTGFGGNADGVTKQGDVITSVTAPTEEQVKSIANNAATVGDVLNAGWNLQNNGTAKDFVKPYDTVNFVDGVGTTAVVDTAADGLSSTVTFNVNKGKVAVSDGTTTDVNGDTINNGALVNTGAVDAQKALDEAKQALDEAKAELDAANATGDTDAIKAAQDKVNKAQTAEQAAEKAVQNIGDAVATVDNVVNAINKSGWSLTTSASDGTVSGTTTELINPGETVTFDAGTNITIKQNGNTITIATGDNPFEYTVTETAPDGSTTTSTVTKAPNGKVYKTDDVKNAVYNPVTQAYEEPVIGGDGSPVLNPDGTPAMKTIDPVSDDVANTLTVHTKGDTPQTISNVKSNLPEANKGNAGGTNTGFGGNADGVTKQGDVITSVTAPTEEQVKSIANNAATVGDVLNAGWNLQNNGTAKDFVKPYDTVNFVDGVGTTAVVDTAADGLSSTVTFNVNKGKVAVSDGTTTDVNGDTINNGALVNTGAVDAQKALDEAKQALDEAKAELDAANATGDTDAIKAAQDKVNKAQTAEQAAEKAVQNIGDAVATVDNVVNAINKSGWSLTTSASDGTVSGTTTELINPGETVTIDAGKNISIKQNGNKITIATKDDVDFTSVTTGNTKMDNSGVTVKDAEGNSTAITAGGTTTTDKAGNTTSVKGDGIRIQGKDKQEVSLTENGLDNGNNKITNVAAGEADTDAVNVSQLKETAGNVINSSPFEYTTIAGDAVTVGKDGNKYKTDDLANATYDPDTKTYKTKNGDEIKPVDEGKTLIHAKGSDPQSITNVKSNLPETNAGNAGGSDGFYGPTNGITKNGDVITGVSPMSKDFVQAMSNHAATVGDVLNAGWNLQNNGTAKDFVKPYDTVNFIDGVGTTAVVDTTADGLSSTVTFNVNQGKFAVSDGTTTNVNGDKINSGALVNTGAVDAKNALDKAKQALDEAKAELDAANITGDAAAIKVAQDKVAKAQEAEQAAGKAVQNIGDAVATVDNVVNAINNSGWTLTTSESTGKATGTSKELINPGETVTLDAGKNISITQDKNSISIATKDDVDFASVTTGNTKMDNNGVTVKDAEGNSTTITVGGTTTEDKEGNTNTSSATGNTITDKDGNTTSVKGNGIRIKGKDKQEVSLTENGLDNGNNKITNVAAGRADTDAVNVKQLKDTIGDAINNVVADSPFEYADKDGNALTTGKDGNKYKPSDLEHAKYNPDDNTYTDANGDIIKPVSNDDVVIHAKGNTPQSVTNVKSNLPDANNGNAGGTDTGFDGTEGSITKNGDVVTSVIAPTEEQVKSIANNAASVGDVLNAGWNIQGNGEAKDFVKAYDTVNFVDGKGTTAKVDSNGEVTNVSFDVNTGSMTAETGKAVNNNQKAIDAAKKDLAAANKAWEAVNKDPNATQAVKDKAKQAVAEKQAVVDAFDNQVATVKDVVDTINNTYWTATSGKEGTGVVESTTKESVKAGDEVTFKAGNNLKLVQDGKNFTYSLQDSISLTEVKTGHTVMNTSGLQVGDGQGSLTTIGSNGITIGGNDRQSVSLTNTGLDNGGNKIINVAPGEADTDAVNVSQLKDAVGNTNVRINQLSSDIKHVGAKAAALSSLKTIQYDPLEPTQISAGVGYYGGASALAIGVSHYKNESTLFSGGIAFGGSEGEKVMANASVTWKLGHRADETAVKDTYRQGPISSAYVLQDKVDSLMAENTAQKRALASQQEEIDDLKAKLAKVMNQLGV